MSRLCPCPPAGHTKDTCMGVVMEKDTCCSGRACSVTPALCNPVDCSRLLCPWGSPVKNTGMGFHALLQGIFPTLDRTDISLSPALAGGFFTTSATWEDCCFGHSPHFINGSIEALATEVTWPAVTVHVLVLNTGLLKKCGQIVTPRPGAWGGTGWGWALSGEAQEHHL